MAKGKEFPLSIVLRAVDKFTAPMRRMNARVAGFFKPFEKLRSKLSALSAAAHLDKLFSRFGAFKDSVGAVIGKVTALSKKLALMAVAGAAAGFALVRSFAMSGDAAAKTALRLGIGVEALQEYRYAAERAGIPVATFDMAMQRMGRRVGEAAAGTGEARVALNALGISAIDAAGKVRSVEDILPELADKLSRVESANVRNALAMKLFDSEGVALVQMLEGGSKGLAEMREEARRLGLVIDREATESSEDFADAMLNLKGSVLGVRNVIGSAFLPVVSGMIRKVTELTVGNRRNVDEWARDFADGLPDRLESLRAGFFGVLQELRALFSPVDFLINRFGLFRTVAIAIAAVIFGPLLAALGQMTAAFGMLTLAAARSLIVLSVGFIPMLKTGVLWLGRFALALLTQVIPAVWKFTAALLANPIVLLVTAVTLLVVGLLDVMGLLDGIGDRLNSLKSALPDWLERLLGGDPVDVNLSAGGEPVFEPTSRAAATRAAENAAAAESLRIERQEQTVRLTFENMPDGLQVSTEGGDIVEMDLGPAMTTL